MSQFKAKTTNAVREWNANLRLKVNDVVKHLGSLYQNTSGKNSEPGVNLGDWAHIGISNDNLLVHKAGTEIITGAKRFNNIVTIDGASYLVLKSVVDNDFNISASDDTFTVDDVANSKTILKSAVGEISNQNLDGFTGVLDFSLLSGNRNFKLPNESGELATKIYVGNLTGWNDRTDTVTNQVLTANTDNLIQISTPLNGNGSNTLLDANSKITPTSLNDLISVDFAFQYVSPIGTSNFLQVYLKVNGNIYRAYTHLMVRPVGLTDYVSVSFVLPVKSDFLTHGGLLYINPVTSITITNRYIAAGLIHKGV